MTKVNQLDFTGTIVFCGIDVYKLSWRVNLRDAELELKDFTQPADAGLLHKHFAKNYLGAKCKAGYEAGFCKPYAFQAANTKSKSYEKTSQQHSRTVARNIYKLLKHATRKYKRTKAGQ